MNMKIQEYNSQFRYSATDNLNIAFVVSRGELQIDTRKKRFYSPVTTRQ